MYRFFKAIKDDENFIIEGSDFTHIVRVLRHRVHDKVEIVHESEVYICEIEEITKTACILKIIEKSEKVYESPLDITLYQGIAKGFKLDTIVQKAVELGVNKVVPVIMKRSVVKTTGKEDKKKERLEEIAYSAAKQSKRTIIPEVGEIISLKDAINSIKKGIIIVPYENETTTKFSAVLEKYTEGQSIHIFIGPEGGFADEEIEMLEAKDAHIISLGNRILRTETAGMAIVSIVQYCLGDLK